MQRRARAACLLSGPGATSLHQLPRALRLRPFPIRDPLVPAILLLSIMAALVSTGLGPQPPSQLSASEVNRRRSSATCNDIIGHQFLLLSISFRLPAILFVHLCECIEESLTKKFRETCIKNFNLYRTKLIIIFGGSHSLPYVSYEICLLHRRVSSIDYCALRSIYSNQSTHLNLIITRNVILAENENPLIPAWNTMSILSSI